MEELREYWQGLEASRTALQQRQLEQAEAPAGRADAADGGGVQGGAADAPAAPAAAAAGFALREAVFAALGNRDEEEF
jgi:hypothetical protein